MKRLLRSVIDFEDNRITKDSLGANFQRLQASGIEWTQPVDEKIYRFCHEFFGDNFELPTISTLRDYFQRADDIEVLERLKDIEVSPVYVRKNYQHLLNQLLEDQNRINMRAILKEVEEIVTKGKIIQEGREKVTLSGVKDALGYFNERVYAIIPTDSNARTHGDLRDDSEVVWQEYQAAKRDQGKVFGSFCGINDIDKVCHGCKRGELWIHAAFAGELKTTFATTWAYNSITRYRRNVLYISMEMPFDQIRRLIYVMHSSNAKWRDLGYEPLDYRQVRDGELSEKQEEFYRMVLEDFHSNPEYARFEVWAPDKDISIEDARQYAELMHKQMDVGLVVFDHGGLMESRKRHRDYTIELNSVLRDTKKFALHFNGGEGVPVLMLFQINRQGKDEADKNEGRYKMKALSYANEAERSADYITTSYLNDGHRTNGTTVMCNLKNRDNPLFAPFTASVDFRCRRLFNYDPNLSTAEDITATTEEEHDEMMQSMMNV